MRPDSSFAYAPRVSPATWSALTALLLLLGALGVLLEGCFTKPDPPPPVAANHYGCHCTCRAGSQTGFEDTARVRVIFDPVANIRQDPAGTLVGNQGRGAEGNISGNFVDADDLNGGTARWWNVNFDEGVSGWVIQAALEVRQVVLDKPKDVCVPPELNGNLTGTLEPPSTNQVLHDCADRVSPGYRQRAMDNLPPDADCSCELTDPATQYDASCDQPCTDPSGVCTVMNQDPAVPTPTPLSAAVFSTTSLCQVQGSLTLDVNGHTPKTQPNVRGVLQIHGRPCPGGSCGLGVSYDLSGDDIEFDSGTIFASDPKFVDLHMTGATDAGAIQVGPIFGCTDCSFGPLPAAGALSTVQGRRAGDSKPGAVVVRNTQGLALSVNWVDKTCRLAGDLVGQVDGDQKDGTLDVQASVVLDGVLVNQPPLANAGNDRTVECTSPSGADITLSGAGSTDPDGNIAFYVWRRGSETGPQVSDPSPNPVVNTHQAIGQTTYSLTVVDTNGAVDSASVKLTVGDKTPPIISCNAPATITPPDRPVAFTATAADTCGAAPVVIDSFKCFEVKSNGQTVDKSSSCKVAIDGATLRVNNSGGVGTTIQWQARATDAAGNVARKACELFVADPGKGK